MRAQSPSSVQSSPSLHSPMVVACQVPLSLGKNTGVGCHAIQIVITDKLSNISSFI